MSESATRSRSKLRTFTLAAAISIIGCVAAPSAFAYEGISYRVDSDAGTVAVAGCFDSCPSDLDIASSIEGLPVTSIDDYAFEGVSGISTITIPDTVTSIGAGAFNGVSGVTSVTIPNSVTTMGRATFQAMPDLTTVTFAVGSVLTTIPESAFRMDRKLASITLPASITSIGDFAFYEAETLAAVTFSANAPTVGEEAFGVVASNAQAVLASNTLTGYGPNGDLFNRLVVAGGRDRPAWPILSGVPAPFTNSTSASISFSGVDGATFTCSVDNGSYAPCGDSPKVLSGLSEGRHSLAVKQTDTYGYTSDAAWAIWTIDLTAPGAPSITAPTTADSIFGLDVPFKAAADGADHFECSLDGADWTACPAGQNGAGDGSRVIVGPNTILHWGEADSSEGFSAGISGAIGPVAPLYDTSDFASNPLGAPFTVVQLMAYLMSGGATTDIPCADVADFMQYMTGGDLLLSTLDRSKFNAFPLDCANPLAEVPTSVPGGFKNLSIGSHTLQVKAVDAAGNKGEATEVTWSVVPPDTNAPDAPILSGAPDAVTTDSSASIGFSGEAGAVFTCSVDGGSWEPCGDSPKALSGLADGDHSLSVKATDAAGNTSEAATASWKVDTALNYTFSDTDATVTGCNGSCPSSLTIPAAVNGKPVVGIANAAFQDATGLTSVSLPSGLVSIGDDAFRNTAIAAITIPDSVTSIGARTFWDAKSLTDVTLPSGLTSLSAATFAFTEKLTTITLPASLKTIGADAFWHSGLTGLVIPNGVETIKECAFCDLADFTSITIPNSVTTLEGGIFQNTTKLTSITLPSGITSVPSNLFAGGGLTSVTVPEGVTSIGDSAFRNLADLESITLPSTLTDIGANAFRNDGKLATVRFNGNAPTVQPDSDDGDVAFSGLATGAKAVLGSLSLTGYGDDKSQFHGLTVTYPLPYTYSIASDEVTITGCNGACPASLTIPAEIEGKAVTAIGETAFRYQFGLKSITLPNSLRTIGRWAFKSTGLTAITIPAGVTSIRAAAFVNSRSLATVTFLGNAPAEIADDSTLPFYGLADGARAILGSSSLTGYGYNGDRFHGLIVYGGIDRRTTPAAPRITGGPQASTSARSATITFTGESGAQFTCSLDGKTYASCTSPKSYTGLSVGAHSVAVRQTNRAGLTGAAAIRRWTVTEIPCAKPTVVGTPTLVVDRVPVGDGKTAIGFISRTTGRANDSRAKCKLNRLQLAMTTVRPANTPAVSPFDYARGFYAYSLPVYRVGSKPQWVRVQNLSGLWSDWSAIR